MNGRTVERIIKIYDDHLGTHYCVGPDAEGLDCVEIRSVDDKGEIDARIFLGEPAHAVLVARAILELYDRGTPE